MLHKGILFTLLSLWCNTYYPNEATGHQIWCNDCAWTVVSNTSRGLEVQMDQIAANLTSGEIEVFEYHYLPPQCAQPEGCNSIAVGEWLALPSKNSLVFLNLASPEKRFVQPIDHDCNPTNLFLDQDTLWVTCVNSTDNLFRLIYLPYFITRTGDQLDIEYAFYTPYHPVPQSSPFSRSLFIYDSSCFSHGASNLYTMTADGYVWHFPASGGVDLVFTPSARPLENCSSIDYIDFRSGTSFTVHCSGGFSATYDTCYDQWNHHLNKDGLYFSCSLHVETLFKNDSIRVTYTNKTTIWHENHTIGDIQHGGCNEDVFNAVAVNGSLYSFVFSLGIFYMVAQNVCDSAGSCFWPTFDQDTSRFIGIDRGNATLFLVSVVAECIFPVKEVIVNNIPESAMIHFISSPGTGTHSCQCSYAGHYPDGSESSTPATTFSNASTTITSSTQVLIPVVASVFLLLLVGGVVLVSILLLVWRRTRSKKPGLSFITRTSDNGVNSYAELCVDQGATESGNVNSYAELCVDQGATESGNVSHPELCDDEGGNSGLVIGKGNPLNSNLISSREVIEVQEQKKATNENSRNITREKTLAMVQLNRENTN